MREVEVNGKCCIGRVKVKGLHGKVEMRNQGLLNSRVLRTMRWEACGLQVDFEITSTLAQIYMTCHGFIIDSSSYSQACVRMCLCVRACLSGYYVCE